MWIIPKNLDVSACVRATLELSWDLKELSRICERCFMWRSKPSLVRTWSQRLKRVGWMQHLSGRILKPSTDSLFETEYTSSLAVIPVKERALPANDSGEKTLDGFGRILNESFRQLDLFGASSRTSVDTLQLDSPKFIEAYGIWVTKLRQDCLQRQSAVRRTDGNGCLSWRSPAEQPAGISTDKLTGSLGKRMYHKKTGRLAQYGLDQQVNWPTPAAQNFRDGKASKETMEKNARPLQEVVVSGLLAQDSPNTNGKSRGLWATPRTETMEACTSKGYGDTLLESVMGKKGYQKKKRLNPDWVEQLMGLQVGWTGCDFSATESSLLVQKKHLET